MSLVVVGSNVKLHGVVVSDPDSDHSEDVNETVGSHGNGVVLLLHRVLVKVYETLLLVLLLLRVERLLVVLVQVLERELECRERVVRDDTVEVGDGLPGRMVEVLNATRSVTDCVAVTHVLVLLSLIPWWQTSWTYALVV